MSADSARTVFNSFVGAAPKDAQDAWMDEERRTLNSRVRDPSTMDIFQHR